MFSNNEQVGKALCGWDHLWAGSLGFYKRAGWASPEVVPPKGPSQLVHYLRTCLRVGSHGGISSTEAPFSVITLAVWSWHKTSQYRSIYYKICKTICFFKGCRFLKIFWLLWICRNLTEYYKITYQNFSGYP